MRVSALIGALTAVVLAGCAPVTSPDSKGQTAAFKNETAKAFVAGYSPVEVVVSRNNTDLTTPTACKIDSAKYKAQFTAPATVNLPAYSAGAVPAKLICELDGKQYASTFNPINLSKRSRNQSSIGVGILLCPICGLAMAASNSANGNERENDIYGFAELKLEL